MVPYTHSRGIQSQTHTFTIFTPARCPPPGFFTAFLDLDAQKYRYRDRKEYKKKDESESDVAREVGNDTNDHWSDERRRFVREAEEGEEGRLVSLSMSADALPCMKPS